MYIPFDILFGADFINYRSPYRIGVRASKRDLKPTIWPGINFMRDFCLKFLPDFLP
jgi:hypothetical protein